jgi:hypothetical protein
VDSIPTFAILPRSPSVGFHSHHHEDSLAVQPLAQQHRELDIYRFHIFPILPHARPLPPSLMATSHIIPPNPLLFLTRARLCPPGHSTITDHIIRCRLRQCQPQQPQRQSRPPSLPHDTLIICARCHRQSHPSAVRTRADPSGPEVFFTPAKMGAGVLEVFAYVGAPCRDAVGMGREAHASGPVVGNGSTVRLADAMTGTKGFSGKMAMCDTYVYFCSTFTLLPFLLTWGVLMF